MSIIKIPDVECLRCKTKGGCVTDSDYVTKTEENFILRPIICTRCNAHWKDFYEADNETSAVLSKIRNKGEKGSSSDSA